MWQTLVPIFAQIVAAILEAPTLKLAEERAKRALLAASGSAASEAALKKLLGRAK